MAYILNKNIIDASFTGALPDNWNQNWKIARPLSLLTNIEFNGKVGLRAKIDYTYTEKRRRDPRNLVKTTVVKTIPLKNLFEWNSRHPLIDCLGKTVYIVVKPKRTLNELENQKWQEMKSSLKSTFGDKIIVLL